MKREISEIEAKRVEQHQEMTDDQVIIMIILMTMITIAIKMTQIIMTMIDYDGNDDELRQNVWSNTKRQSVF